MDKEEVINEIVALHKEHSDYDDDMEKEDRERLAGFTLEQCLENLKQERLRKGFLWAARRCSSESLVEMFLRLSQSCSQSSCSTDFREV